MIFSLFIVFVPGFQGILFFTILIVLILRNPASWPDKPLTEGCIDNEFNILKSKTAAAAMNHFKFLLHNFLCTILSVVNNVFSCAVFMVG